MTITTASSFQTALATELARASRHCIWGWGRPSDDAGAGRSVASPPGGLCSGNSTILSPGALRLGRACLVMGPGREGREII
jgi:hypothetical protein